MTRRRNPLARPVEPNHGRSTFAPIDLRHRPEDVARISPEEWAQWREVLGKPDLDAEGLAGSLNEILADAEEP